MPARKDTLTDSDSDAAVAFFRSKWSDDVYAAWLERNCADGGLSPAAALADYDGSTRCLRQRFPTRNVCEPKSTPVAGGCDACYRRLGLGPRSQS